MRKPPAHCTPKKLRRRFPAAPTCDHGLNDAVLSEDGIKTLVVDDKWLATIAAAVHGELDRVSQTLTGRIRQLAERYANPAAAVHW